MLDPRRINTASAGCTYCSSVNSALKMTKHELAELPFYGLTDLELSSKLSVDELVEKAVEREVFHCCKVARDGFKISRFLSQLQLCLQIVEKMSLEKIAAHVSYYLRLSFAQLRDWRRRKLAAAARCSEESPITVMNWFEPESPMETTAQLQKVDRIHSPIESPFSSASGFTNFRGLLNLGLILLVVSNFRVALENVIKYGILVDPFAAASVFLSDPYHWPCTVLVLLINLFSIALFGLELVLERGRLHEGLGRCFRSIILITMLVFPTVVILRRHPNPFFSSMALGVYTVCFLKLWSYGEVNSWCRVARGTNLMERRRNKSVASALNMQEDHLEGVVCYPDNLNLSDLYYFLFAPTLCYELNFPRTLNIRKRFLLKRVLELIFVPQIIGALVQQWIIPLLQNSLRPFSHSERSAIVERCLKLAIPNHLLWLMAFYVFFHSGLNVVAELLRFGDRQFYKDWWNAESVTEFWSTWNIPVHRFARRHIYLPLIHQRGLGRLPASIMVFLVSAFFHEFLVSVPLHMFRLWAFAGMIAQVPFAMFVSKVLRGGQLRNMAVWVSLIIGQPLAIMMYFHDYYVQQKSSVN